MTKIDASERIDYSRRRLFGVAALSAAVAQLGLIRAGQAQTKIVGPAGDQAWNELFVRAAQAAQCRPPECRIR
jgi:hypothetical protein